MNNNNNRQSVNNFVYRKKDKNQNQNNNTQSVNNFVYRKNRDNNSPQTQPRQNNIFDFTDRNTQPQNTDNSYNNNYTASNNYNSYVSENDYNSYTSGYQPTNSYNNYNNNFNDSFYNGNNYNNNYQPYQQNNYPNYGNNIYQDYNTPVNYQNNNEPPVEVPIPRRLKLSSVIVLISFFAPFLLMTFAGSLAAVFPFLGDIILILFSGIFIIPLIGMIVGFRMERKHLQTVCTVPVTGHLVGYAKQRRSHKHHHYTVYAPKYEIFINNRREIRTIDDFTRGQHGTATANLLANPNGYEIIPAERNFGQSRTGEIMGTIILVIIIVCFILPIFFGF